MWIHEATPANPLYQLANETLGLSLSPVVNYNAGQVFDDKGAPVNMAFYAVSEPCKDARLPFARPVCAWKACMPCLPSQWRLGEQLLYVNRKLFNN